MLGAGLAGFGLGAGLIIAIGAQNAFVLRHGLMRHHVLAICLFCAASDALLIGLGVSGFGSSIAQSPWLLQIVAWGGAAFLAAYGTLAFRRALNPSQMTASTDSKRALGPTLATCAAFTFLNPHVYLDTVILVGGLSATYPGSSRIAFGAGAMLSSFAWFFSLGYGARLLDGIFAKPGAWRMLDVMIGIVMWALAVKVALPFL
jgi:L-lysine exporter family protein LysE/ArgO